ncbi:MAG: hypothetical protein A3B30_03065 [Candidatus Komeilibacteria bacterium RIFCSPLOWO2_01_FULL_52_15]|uniref:Spore protein YkvP/CgeB glycosyl transferase-like domain-containing protein n=2 Tax=Candidatus Komeiliibacteriota TaxID=1817908 RepID=A0A1G2BMR2_9BACT|nr:MAG: hypothetical protein A2677_03505 [Candidatus Komeilibacteria bacterium RIFCSPHIGHO2_01_FULL_52_14]OGY90433.1 MAG: hypothetical protein A3B30_03065 [Candidatus Komeilibacteria bacterium RIFCSPLOWO2_01_FULL_52_15]
MKTFDVIMVNMSSYAEWQRGTSNRNYHVLRELAHDSRVGKILAVDYPPLTIKRGIRNYMENIFPTLSGGSVLTFGAADKLTKLGDKLFVYTNSAFFLSPDRFIKRLKAMAHICGLSDYLLWSFFPPVMEYTQTLGQKLTVFDAVDNWIEHPSYVKFKERLKRNYQYVKQHSDVIFTVAQDLMRLFDNQPNVYWIPNGVELSHYQSKHILINRDIANIPKPIVGYIGVIQERVDTELIVQLASKNPTKSFVLVGPVWREEDKKTLARASNIFLLGYKSYDEAPAYIQQFDVAMIPHRRSTFIESTNPMKMYEYLACGKPVVATRESGAALFNEFVYLADDAEDFNRKLYHALQEDSPEKQKARRAAVEEHSWQNVVKQMLDIIEKKMGY